MDSTLDAARYFNLATFRKNGAAVETPVWFAPGDDRDVFFVFSAGDAGKVKRLRRSDEARVAPCDVRGRLTGEWRPARGELLVDHNDVVSALAALRNKYGWKMWLTDNLARFAGRFNKRAYIRITLH